MLISELKPGPELDALIAKKVMGATKKCMGPNPNVALLSGPLFTFVWQLPDGTWWLDEYPAPDYSTSIENAWQVVEKLKDAGQSVEIFTTCVHGPEETRVLLDGVEMVPCSDINVPHAICLAALKAVGYE